MNKDVIKARKDTDGKNKNKIYCTFCPSKMLNAGAASLVNMEVSIVYFEYNRTLTLKKFATIILFSNTRYFICALCIIIDEYIRYYFIIFITSNIYCLLLSVVLLKPFLMILVNNRFKVCLKCLSH